MTADLGVLLILEKFMSLSKTEITSLVEKFGKNPQDTGSPEVQIALLTNDIAKLTEHFKIHKKDHHSRMGLLKKVNLRRDLLSYLKKQYPERYRKVISELEIRG
jgi:small subunit ribosomal protein S15